MLDAPHSPGAASSDLVGRRQIALARVQQLIAASEERAARAWRRYFTLQCLTVGLAALTPCFIILAKETPGSWLLNWLQLFFPAIAAIAAGVSHLFHWREDAVRYTTLAETIRSQLWRFQTGAGEFIGLNDDQSLDRLVVRVDELNLQSVARWSSSQLVDGPTPARPASPREAART